MSNDHHPIAAGKLLSTHDKRIELVRQCANESVQAEFDRKWLSVLRRCAAWFSSMPLTPELHCEPGGAFRATVESTFYAMRLAGGQKFAADLTSEKRRRLEPQYNYAVFLAAACSSLEEPCRHFEFTRDSDRTQWSPAAHGAFGEWIGSGSYSIARRVTPLKSERMRTAMFAQMVVTPELLAGLDTAVLADLFGAINPEKAPQGFEALVHKVVRQALDVAVDFERKAQRGVFAPVKFDVPSAVHVALELQPQATTVVPATAGPIAPSSTPLSTASASAGSEMPGPSSVGQAPVALTSVGQAPVAPTLTQVREGSPTGPQLSQSLLDALERSELQSAAAPTAVLATVGATADAAKAASVDPSTLGAASKAARTSISDQELNDVLGPGAAMMREFFRALADDVAAGKAKVTWEEKGLTIQKRLIGAYGMTSETLVEQLRKRSLLLRVQGTEICMVERAGRLIVERPAA